MIKEQDYLQMKEQFDKMEKSLRQVYYELFLTEPKEGHPDVYDSALALVTATKELMVLLDLSDENMDLEKTNLVSLDEILDENPLTRFVKAKIAAVQAGEDDEEAMKKLEEAAEAAAEYQKGPQPAKPETYDEFITRVVEEMEVVEEGGYADMFRKSLKSAIDHLQTTRDYGQFMVNTTSGNMLGSVTLSNDTVIIKLKDTTWKHTFFDETEEEEDAEEDVCTGDPSTCYCGREENIYETVEAASLAAAGIIMSTMSEIEEHLTGKTEYTEQDIELVRYYMKNLPSNSDFDIDKLEDQELVMAWHRIAYVHSK